jgi:hypothetical protein
VNRLYLLLAAFLSVQACAPSSVNEYNTGETEEEVIGMLNQRDYAKAVWLLEQNDAKNLEGRLGFLLGQAYLGKAGIEPLDFAAKITGPQTDSLAARTMFPKCPADRISSVKAIKSHCLLKRIYLLAPNADHPDFAKAREYMRKSYPNPALAPQWVNTLIGLVETISVVKRVGDVYLFSRDRENRRFNLNTMTDIKWVRNQGELALAEGREALNRANYSGEKISQFLNGSKANQWFERVEGTVRYAKTVGLSRFLDFARDTLIKPEDEIRHGEALDKLKTVLDSLENENAEEEEQTS